LELKNTNALKSVAWDSPTFLASLSAEPGTVARGLWAIGVNPAGSPEGIPVFVLQGVEEGPTLWIQATVHGDEFAASWAVSTLAREIDPRQLKGRLILFPILHLHAFLARQKLSPIDGLDISHQVPGDPKGSYTQRVAYAINQVMIKEADAMIDVHSGTSTYFCIEFTSYPANLAASDKAEAMALATGSPVVLRWPVSSRSEVNTV
jgi:predicted deacylase